MARVPTLQNAPSIARTQISGVSISNPLVADRSAEFKSRRLDSLSNIFSKANRFAEAKLAKIKAAQRAETIATESVATRRFQRDVMESAKDMEDDQVLDFVRGQFQARMDSISKQYGSDVELKARLYEDLQRQALITEDAMLDFVEDRQRTRHLATLDQLIFDSKAAILSTDKENVRASYFQDVDSAIDGALSLGHIDEVQAGKLKRGARSEMTQAIIRDAVSKGKTGFAAAYLEANREFIGANAQATLEGQIRNEMQRQQNSALAAQTRALAQQNKALSLAAKGGAYRADAAVMMGVDANNPKALYTASGSPITSQQAKIIKGQIQSGQLAPNEFLQSLETMRVVDPKMVDGYFDALESVGLDTPPLQGFASVAASTNLDDNNKIRLMSVAMEMNNAETVKSARQFYEDTAGEKIDDLTSRIIGSSRFSSFRKALIDQGGEGLAHSGRIVEFVKDSAAIMHAKHGVQGDDLIDDVLSWMPPEARYIHMDDGVTMNVPEAVLGQIYDQAGNPSGQGIPLDIDKVERGLSKFKSALKPGEIIAGDNKTTTKQKWLDSGKLSWRKMSSSRDTKVILVDPNGYEVLDAATRRPIVMDMISVQGFADALGPVDAAIRQGGKPFEVITKEEMLELQNNEQNPMDFVRQGLR